MIAGFRHRKIGPTMDAASWIAVIPDAAVVVGADGVIIAANSQAALLFGYSVEALQQMSVDVLIPETLRPRHRDHRARYNESPRQRPMAPGRTLSALRSDNTIINVEIALGPVEQGTTIAIIRDISARHQQESSEMQRRLIELQDRVITMQQQLIKTDDVK